MANKLVGVTSFSISGTNYSVVGGLTYSTNTVKREALSSMTSGLDGYKETPVPGMIKAKLRLQPTDSVSDFDNMTDETVVAGLANGTTVTAYDAVLMDLVTYEADEATIDVEFSASLVSED